MAHVSLVTLGVADLVRATRFYEAMGWIRSSVSVAGTVSFLRGGAVVLALFGRADLAHAAGVPLAGDLRTSDIALAMNVGSPEEVDAVLASAAEAGGRVTSSAAEADWGGYSGYFADPDGHLWEVAHNPGFPLLADGRIQLPEAE
jgi:uncharacterized protein